MKLSSQQLSDVIIESMALSVSLLERFEIMNENDLFIQKAKQSLKNTIPHIEQYVTKLIKANSVDQIDHFKKGATVIAELSNRIEAAVRTRNIMDISARQDSLQSMIANTNLGPEQQNELFQLIKQSKILNY